MVKYFLSLLFCSMVVMFINASQDSIAINPSNESVGSYKIEGKIIVPPGDNAFENTRILIDEGLYVGIPQVMEHLSYVVFQVVHILFQLFLLFMFSNLFVLI